MAELRILAWLVSALRAQYEGSTARIVFGGVLTESVFDIARGIKPCCPSSGSVWALVFDPAARLLCAHLRGPLDEISVFAGDIAVTLARLSVGLPLLFRVFGLLAAAAGLVVSYAKTLVVSFSGQSGFLVKRRLVEVTGIARRRRCDLQVCPSMGIASVFAGSAPPAIGGLPDSHRQCVPRAVLGVTSGG